MNRQRTQAGARVSTGEADGRKEDVGGRADGEHFGQQRWTNRRPKKAGRKASGGAGSSEGLRYCLFALD